MVVLKEHTNMFWGITLDGGKRYSQTVEQPFHISMAAIEHKSKKGGGDGDHKSTVAVMIIHEKAEFLLCSLNATNLLQQPLDLNFTEGEEVTFYLTGNGSVHLTGYLHEDMGGEDTLMDDEDMSEEDLTDESEEEESEDDDDNEVPTLKQLKDMDGKDELDDEDEEDEDDWTPSKGKRKKKEKTKPSKKTKVEVVEAEEDEDDDDDDDDDYDIDNFLDAEASESDSGEESDDDDLDLPPVESDDDAESIDSTGSYEQPAKQTKQSKKKTEKKETETKPAKKDAKKTKEQQTPSASSGQVDETKLSKSARKRLRKKAKEADHGEKKGEKTPAEKKTPATESQKPSKTPKKQVVAGGTVIEELKPGHGPEAKSGKMVGVFYTGKLLQNGKVFDSCQSGKPFKFKLGKGEVIKGWDNGVAGMAVGSKRRITVPASQGYGSQKMGPIPANSTLVFEVELKSVS